MRGNWSYANAAPCRAQLMSGSAAHKQTQIINYWGVFNVAGANYRRFIDPALPLSVRSAFGGGDGYSTRIRRAQHS